METEVGYHGSKSVMNNFIVKEQRVDGSWCEVSNSRLRYTLKGFERNYQVRILSLAGEKVSLQRFFFFQSSTKLRRKTEFVRY